MRSKLLSPKKPKHKTCDISEPTEDYNINIIFDQVEDMIEHVNDLTMMAKGLSLILQQGNMSKW